MREEGGLMRGIKIPLQDFALKMKGGLMCEGGRGDTMVIANIFIYKYAVDSNIYYCVFINTPRVNNNFCREMLQVQKIGTWVLSSNQLIGNCISASLQNYECGKREGLIQKHENLSWWMPHAELSGVTLSAIYKALILYFKDNKFLKHLYELTHCCTPSFPQAHFCSYPPDIVITIIVGILVTLVVMYMVRSCYDRGKIVVPDCTLCLCCT